ncbi:hypothetical protein AVEN_19972-1 [Araneus ventricosus]|uniref:Uncharacterized protein n=1 Tax=Araneus ventricosus TaxID=182803 RepID=A0A4Y2R8H6_ARAVE|nr:hypothetical protein AVEN_19972-1 [Araneus ventricosus]
MNQNCNCQVRYKDYDSCIHNYIRSCIDSAVKWNTCKHIHFICMDNKKAKDVSQENLVIDETVATCAIENTVPTATPRPINEDACNLTPNESDALIKQRNNSESSLPLSQQREKLREYSNIMLDYLATAEELNVART